MPKVSSYPLATPAAGDSVLGIQADGDVVRFPVGLVSATGLLLTVLPFAVGAFEFTGGTITATPSGTWYVGVEISSKQLRTLPRLGHRGWVPVGKVVTDASGVTSVQQITPAMPACRIPRTMTKVLAGLPIKAVVMGSSLTQSSGAATDWPGMVFGAGTADKYKVPTTVTCAYTGVGGSPNQYQLAQLGFGSSHSAIQYGEAGWPLALGPKAPPNGRSALLTGVDVVVLGCLANGGDYRLEMIEPLVRKLREQGVEVILATDNAQGPSTDYATMSAASLYVDGPEIFRVADLYGVEVADTAAYVFDAHLRAGGVGIYNDSIHMAGGVPSGAAAVVPANGHEAWARAVRSVFSVVDGRAMEVRHLPPIRVVTDLKTPADTFITLPKDCREFSSGQATKGALAAHPWGVSSFARRFSPATGAAEDLLVLEAGKKESCAAVCAVGFSLIHYREPADGAVTFDVIVNSTTVKTITIPAVPFGNEWLCVVRTPAEMNVTTVLGNPTVQISVTSGTLKIAALVALTADVSYVPAEEIDYLGTGWLPKEDSRSGLPGRPTDALNDIARVRCPATGRRVAWVLSSNPGTKAVDAWSGRESIANVDYGGQYHIKLAGGLLGPGEHHVIRCAVANASGSQANGHALHVGGAIIINDR